MSSTVLVSCTNVSLSQARSKLNLSGLARACAQCAQSMHLLGGLEACPPGNFWNFRRSEINSSAFWDTCLSWQGTCYKLIIVYTCEKDCKYSTIINSDWQWPTHYWNFPYVLCMRAEPGPSLNLIPALQCKTPSLWTIPQMIFCHCSESPCYYCTSMTFSAML